MLAHGNIIVHNIINIQKKLPRNASPIISLHLHITLLWDMINDEMICNIIILYCLLLTIGSMLLYFLCIIEVRFYRVYI